MTDQPQTIYTPPRWRVTATYAATDGHTPETLEVECHADDIDGAVFVTAVIPVLADVAAQRRTSYNFRDSTLPEGALAKIGERR